MIFKKDHMLEDVVDMGESLVYGVIEMNFPDYEDQEIKVSTRIFRNDEEKILPKGIGLELYKKILDYISIQSQINKCNITHMVVYEETMGLESDKWSRIFRPLLEDRGYSNITEGEGWKQKWQKTYKYKEKIESD